MNNTELQKLVREIFSSEESRKRFESNPETTLGKYALTQEERKAVIDVHSNMGLVTGDSQQMIAAIRAHFNWWSTAGVEYYY